MFNVCLQFAKILQEYHQKALNRLTELIPRLEENVGKL